MAQSPVRHFNPRSPHGERLDADTPAAITRHFNPRSPHGERQMSSSHHASSSIFQSTLPARGATYKNTHHQRTPHRDFNPRSPHGERHRSRCSGQRALYFNPRSPHGERPRGTSSPSIPRLFQSTLPARGATTTAASTASSALISIHAPRTGSDRRSLLRCSAH